MAQDPVVGLVVTFLTIPATDFYLPKLLAQSTDPNLEPYTSSSIDLGSHSVMGMNMAFSLKDATITGITNVQIKKNGGKPDIQIAGNQVTFTATRPNTEAPPAGVPTEITINSGFEVVVPAPNSKSQTLTGSAVVTVKDADILGVFDATSEDGSPSKAVITFRSLEIDGPATPENINIIVQLDSAFEAFINQVGNSPQVLEKIANNINSQLRSISVLNALSKAGTDAARAAVKQMPG